MNWPICPAQGPPEDREILGVLTKGRPAGARNVDVMNAMVLRHPKPVFEGPLVQSHLPAPTLEPGTILIKIRRCGVCHTDLHEVEGELPPPKLPIVPGHQVVGQVEALGEGVTAFAKGDRVGVPWLYSSCGQCEFCLRGEENLCRDARFTGYHVDGGYADYMVARADYAYALPPQFSDTEAAPLLCAGIIGYRSLRLADVRPHGRVGLFGFGASAHLAIQMARHWGCEVFVFTRSSAHRRLAEALGAVWVGGSEDRPPHDLDSAVVFAPSGRVAIGALRVLRRGGTVAINAVHLDRIPEFDYNLLYWERTLRSVSNSTRRDAREFLELAAAIPIRVETVTFPLEAANEALQALKRAEISGAAVLAID